jgi:hypothetical protein
MSRDCRHISEAAHLSALWRIARSAPLGAGLAVAR